MHLQGELLEGATYFPVVGLAGDAEKIVEILAGRNRRDQQEEQEGKQEEQGRVDQGKEGRG